MTVPVLPTTPPSNDTMGVRLHGPIFKPSATLVPPTHPIWESGFISPVSQMVGVPIYIWREEQEPPFEAPNVASRDNQSVTFMMIRPEDGFAPARCVHFTSSP